MAPSGKNERHAKRWRQRRAPVKRAALNAHTIQVKGEGGRRGATYRLDHHLQVRLVLGHFEEGGGDLSVALGDHFGHDPLQERALLVVRRLVLAARPQASVGRRLVHDARILCDNRNLNADYYQN